MNSTFVVTVLYHGQESFIFCYKILYLFYGPVSLSHFRHFSMFTAASPIWKLPNMLPIFLLLLVPFFLSPIYILRRMLLDWNSPPPSSLSISLFYLPYQRHGLRLIRSTGRGCALAKTDVKNAFRLIPINPCDCDLLGFCWEDSFYLDKCLPMRAIFSCKIWESFSTALEWIAKSKLARCFTRFR